MELTREMRPNSQALPGNYIYTHYAMNIDIYLIYLILFNYYFSYIGWTFLRKDAVTVEVLSRLKIYFSRLLKFARLVLDPGCWQSGCTS